MVAPDVTSMDTAVAPEAGEVTSSPAPARPGRAPGSVHPMLVVPVVILIGISLWGLPYYTAPLAERLRHPLHAWLRPSGLVGQLAGILTFAGFFFMWLYPLRKKLGPRRWLGAIPRWLEIHVLVGLSLPLLGAVHAGWRFGGVIGLGYWAMILVVLSGIAGRYLYTRVPRSRSGLELSVEQIAGERRKLVLELADDLRLSPEEVRDLLTVEQAHHVPRGLLATLWTLMRDDLERRRVLHRFDEKLRTQGKGEIPRHTRKRVRQLAMRQVAMGQQLRVLSQSQRLLRFWHLAHRPVAITALLAVLVHVAVVVAMHATWFY
jgi:hypothetical protein